MQINWFTVIAQAINFLILVWLLKRYLYKPILKAVDEREKRIAAQIEDAEAKKKEADKQRDDFQKKNEEFDGQRKELMNKAVEEAKTERQHLIEEVRQEYAALRLKLDEAMKEEQQNLHSEITDRTHKEVFAITRKTLADLASLSLEEHIVKVFIERLHNINEEEKKQMSAAFKSSPNPIIMRSAFDLTSSQQTEIEKTVKEVLGEETQFHFETAPELVSGIELSANGYKLEWSIAKYFTAIENSINETLKEKSKAEQEIKKNVA